MRIFLSGEIEKKAYDSFHKISNSVEESLKFVCERNVGLEGINNYGTEFNNIGIICIIASQELIDNGRTERRLIRWKTKEADIRLYINYEKFIRETPENQRLMYIKNISDSIDVIISKSKGDFQGKKLKADIFKALNVTQEQLDKIGR